MKTRLSAVSAASNSPLNKATQPSFFQRLQKGKKVTNKKLEVIVEFKFIKKLQKNVQMEHSEQLTD